MASSTWEELSRQYAHFQAMPAWRAAGDIRASTDDRGRLEAALIAFIDKLRARFRDRWPDSPLQFSERHIRLLFPDASSRMALRNPRRTTGPGRLWTAVILDRCDFRCCWCGRSAFETFQREGRTLRLELDHQTPRAGGGHTLSLENIRAACRSCNTLRGRLTADRMRAELISIARAVWKAEGLSNH